MARTITTEEFEQFYRTTAPELFGYMRRRTDADPENLVAEVYAVAWRRRADLPGPVLRRAWLFGTARRLLLAESRRRGREEEHAGYPVPLDVAAQGPDHRLEEAVATALLRLSPEDRELILLVEWERMTPAEVAVVLGIKPGAARMRLHRARQALAADPTMRELVREHPPPVRMAVIAPHD
ncbi:MAG: sigma-70 family RNA polymerase sigma factor [Nocardioides sp.]|uniref:RNA polymerase sigma factor n=1 Tax=Nocardioides sp. TaxID=35761 RepID=UPI0039E4C2BA